MRPFPLVLLLLPAAAMADEPVALEMRDLMMARDVGMGGAYRAHGLGGETIEGNPAGISLFKRYQLEVSGAFDWKAHLGFGTLAIVDSVTSQVGAGVSYHFVSAGTGDQQVFAHLNSMALSLPITENFIIGVTTRHILMSGARAGNAVTTDAGAMLNLFGSLVIGAAGHNLVDIANPYFTRYFTTSLAWMGGLYTLCADVRADMIEGGLKMTYAGGAEYILGGSVPLRAGYSYDSVRTSHFIGLGAGINWEGGGGLDLAYRHEIGGASGRMLALTLRLQSH